MILNYLKNGIEILALSTFFYWFSLWLKKDTKKNLVWYFYSYCLLIFACELSGLSVVLSFALYTAPLLCVVLIIIHEDLLQRNFISMKKSDQLLVTHITPLDEIVRASLYAFNKNKNFFFILEDRCQIESFIETDYPLNADFCPSSLIFFIESSLYDDRKYLWCSTDGKIKGINGSLKIQNFSTDAATQQDTQTQFKHDALLITSQTDTIIIHGDAQSRVFDLVVGGKIQEKISAAQLLPLMRQHGTSKSMVKGDKEYEKRVKTNYQHQQSS